ncbi:MAG TPA: hypothetical protein VN455_13855 [Methanotrichaceae archaeon]|nr:hypothetical protein [Methanotrichaceae archaeon]
MRAILLYMLILMSIASGQYVQVSDPRISTLEADLAANDSRISVIEANAGIDARRYTSLQTALNFTLTATTPFLIHAGNLTNQQTIELGSPVTHLNDTYIIKNDGGGSNLLNINGTIDIGTFALGPQESAMLGSNGTSWEMLFTLTYSGDE